MQVVEITLVERVDEDTENYNHYRHCIPGGDLDALHVDDVLRAFENAMKGFGFVMDNKHLKVVKDN